MSAFTVELGNQPGELARLCEAMASSGVNLLLCATTHGDSGVVAFIADDEAAAQAVLQGAGIQYLIRPAVTVKMANLPGAGAATFRKLADPGVNVDLLLPVRISDDEFYAVICAADPAAARGRPGPGRQRVRCRARHRRFRYRAEVDDISVVGRAIAPPAQPPRVGGLAAWPP